MTAEVFGILLTVAAALVAVFAALPYTWAHLVAAGLSGFLAMTHAGTTVAVIATRKANAKQGKGQ